MMSKLNEVMGKARGFIELRQLCTIDPWDRLQCTVARKSKKQGKWLYRTGEIIYILSVEI